MTPAQRRQADRYHTAVEEEAARNQLRLAVVLGRATSTDRRRVSQAQAAYDRLNCGGEGGNLADHTIRVEYTISGWHRAVCACGNYRSKPYAFPGLAETAGERHVKAKAAR